MRLVTVFFILLITISISFSQSSHEIDPGLDVYGFEVVFNRKVLAEKCDCCCSVQSKHKECVLYEVKIQKLFLHRDSSVYQDSASIIKVKYLVLPSKVADEDLILNSIYTVLAYNSCSDRILVINQLFKGQTSVITKYKGLAFVSGITACKKFTFLQKVFLTLGINRDKIYKKARNMLPNKSKFVQSIGK